MLAARQTTNDSWCREQGLLVNVHLMAILISVNNIEKTMGSKLLFEGLSLGINEGEKVGLIGPNGAGKSTLLKLLAGVDKPDKGEVNRRRHLNIAFVAQEPLFESDSGAKDYLIKRLQALGMDAFDAEIKACMSLSLAGFEDLDVMIHTLSGGWKKRLALSLAIAQEPDLMILDEPTNHMDWDGILWLETWLKSFRGSILLVSHDRTFLDNITNRIVEIHRLYQDGYLSFDCSYHEFIEKKEEYIKVQSALQDSMSNKARREVDWLRSNAKARTTKSQARIRDAHLLLDDLSDVKSRNASVNTKTRLEIDSTGRKSKKLISLTNLTVSFGDKVLVKDLDITLGPKKCLGLLGDNGSGKTSLLKVIQGVSNNYTGEVYRADNLKIVYFDQKREELPLSDSLVSYLGDGSDYVIFKGASIHVASYASRFLFSQEKMQLKISQLSGGEQARLLIAKLMLQPADILILDEPTNDLDIDTIEMLETTLSAFEGLILLVSHDRYFMSQLCDQFLALNGAGAWNTYAEMDQWLRDRKEDTKKAATTTSSGGAPSKGKVRLSYKEKMQLETMEVDIQKAEKALSDAQEKLADPKVLSDHKQLVEATAAAAVTQKKVDDLYELWTVLEEKRKNS
ncbi:MAG: ABC-F family ATP-binding cassette domain-containing protein [Bdellovibrionaceae bacterium]|nr:ABC-F family ATP-binding cassette domain-containing protein [Pseudobdellovibrionaceae bacterium]